MNNDFLSDNPECYCKPKSIYDDCPVHGKPLPDQGESKAKITEEMMCKAWDRDYIPEYFCQVLNGEYSIEQAIEDIRGLLP